MSSLIQQCHNYRKQETAGNMDSVVHDFLYGKPLLLYTLLYFEATMDNLLPKQEVIAVTLPKQQSMSFVLSPVEHYCLAVSSLYRPHLNPTNSVLNGTPTINVLSPYIHNLTTYTHTV